MSSTIADIEVDVRRLRARSGDVVVVQTAEALTSEEAAQVRRQVEGRLPRGVKALVLSGGLEISSVLGD